MPPQPTVSEIAQTDHVTRVLLRIIVLEEDCDSGVSSDSDPATDPRGSPIQVQNITMKRKWSLLWVLESAGMQTTEVEEEPRHEPRPPLGP